GQADDVAVGGHGQGRVHELQLALSSTIAVLLSGYASFQCVSFVLYAFLYGRLPMPCRATRNSSWCSGPGCSPADGSRRCWPAGWTEATRSSGPWRRAAATRC
ncbi:MAG: hypothetical protein ACRDPD_11620, partial [Streptosporangiaceae bacterium]